MRIQWTFCAPGCSVLGTLEPEGRGRDGLAVAERLLATFPGMLLYWHHFTRNRQRLETATNELGVGAHFLHLLHGAPPSPEHARAMDVSLILYTEHEFNASTFACRVVAGTGSDFYSCVCAGIGALRGPLHGGANEAAMAVIEKYRTPEEAETGLMQALAQRQVVMGFGHPVYRVCDPRSDIVKSWARKLSEGHPKTHLYAVSERIEAVMKREKNLFPNLDFFSASAFHFSACRPRCSRRSSFSRASPAGRRTFSSNASIANSSAPPLNTPALHPRAFVPMDQRE
jgi:2-methylcitrate synthase